MNHETNTTGVSLSPVEEQTAAWLRNNMEADPDLASLVIRSAETDWTPLIKFVTWALERDLLKNLRTPQMHQARRSTYDY